MNRLIALLVAVAAVALVAVGCGSSDDSTTDSTDSGASLSKAEFIKEANAICTESNAEIDAGFEEFAEENNLSENKEPTEAQFTEVAETILIPAVSSQLEEIRALGTPEDDGEADELLTNAEEVLEEGEEDPAALSDEQAGGFAEVNKEARAYGLTVCGEE